MNILGLAPAGTFSGFEKTFFQALIEKGATVNRNSVESPAFRLACAVAGWHPRKSQWGLRLNRNYHTSIRAFRLKSRIARKLVEAQMGSSDLVYQIGGLWNPECSSRIPLVLQVDYTSLLSKRRGSEWQRTPGRCQEFWIEQETRLFGDATKILTTTENARQSIINDYGISPNKITTVGAGVSAPYDQLDSERKPDYASRRILFVGKGYVGKGLDTLLEALPIVRKSIPDARLTVIGPNQTVTGSGVDYLGRISDRDQVRQKYYQHAVFCMPSRFEPLGQVFLEAMSCQLPCIGTNVDAMPELIQHNQTGYVIEPGDASQLSRHLISLLSNPADAARIGMAGFDRLRTQYTWPAVGNRIWDNLCQVA